MTAKPVIDAATLASALWNTDLSPSPADVQHELQSITPRLATFFDLDAFMCASDVAFKAVKKYPGALKAVKTWQQTDFASAELDLISDVQILLQLHFEHAADLFVRFKAQRSDKSVVMKYGPDHIGALRDMYITDVDQCLVFFNALVAAAQDNRKLHHEAARICIEKMLSDNGVYPLLKSYDVLRTMNCDRIRSDKYKVLASLRATTAALEAFYTYHTSAMAFYAVRFQRFIMEKMFFIICQRDWRFHRLSCDVLEGMVDIFSDNWADLNDQQAAHALQAAKQHSFNVAEARMAVQGLQVLSIIEYVRLEAAAAFALRTLPKSVVADAHLENFVGKSHTADHFLFTTLALSSLTSIGTKIYGKAMEWHNAQATTGGMSEESLASRSPFAPIVLLWSVLDTLTHSKAAEATVVEAIHTGHATGGHGDDGDFPRECIFAHSPREDGSPVSASGPVHCLNFATACNALTECMAALRLTSSGKARLDGRAPAAEDRANALADLHRCWDMDVRAYGALDSLFSCSLYRQLWQLEGNDSMPPSCAADAFGNPLPSDAPLTRHLLEGCLAKCQPYVSSISVAYSHINDCHSKSVEELVGLPPSTESLAAATARDFLRVTLFARLANSQRALYPEWQPFIGRSAPGDEVACTARLLELCVHNDPSAALEFWQRTIANQELLATILNAAASRFPLQMTLLLDVLAALSPTDYCADMAVKYLKEGIQGITYALPDVSVGHGDGSTELELHKLMSSQPLLRVTSGTDLAQDFVPCELTRSIAIQGIALVSAQDRLPAGTRATVAARHISYRVESDLAILFSSLNTMDTSLDASMAHISNVCTIAVSPSPEASILLLPNHYDNSLLRDPRTPDFVYPWLVTLSSEGVSTSPIAWAIAQLHAALCYCARLQEDVDRICAAGAAGEQHQQQWYTSLEIRRSELVAHYNMQVLRASSGFFAKLLTNERDLLPAFIAAFPGADDDDKMVAVTQGLVGALRAASSACRRTPPCQAALRSALYEAVCSLLSLLLALLTCEPHGFAACLSSSFLSERAKEFEVHNAFVSLAYEVMDKLSAYEEVLHSSALLLLVDVCNDVLSVVDPSMQRVAASSLCLNLLGRLHTGLTSLPIRVNFGSLADASFPSASGAQDLPAFIRYFIRFLNLPDTDEMVDTVTRVCVPNNAELLDAYVVQLEAYAGELLMRRTAELTAEETLLQAAFSFRSNRPAWHVPLVRLARVRVASIASAFIDIAGGNGSNRICTWFALAKAFDLLDDIGCVEPRLLTSYVRTTAAYSRLIDAALGAARATQATAQPKADALYDHDVLSQWLPSELSALQAMVKSALMLLVRCLGFRDGQAVYPDGKAALDGLFDERPPASAGKSLMVAEKVQPFFEEVPCDPVHRVRALLEQVTFHLDTEAFTLTILPDSPIKYTRAFLHTAETNDEELTTFSPLSQSIATLSIQVFTLLVQAINELSTQQKELHAKVLNNLDHALPATPGGQPRLLACCLGAPRAASALHLLQVVNLARACFGGQRSLLSSLINPKWVSAHLSSSKGVFIPSVVGLALEVVSLSHQTAGLVPKKHLYQALGDRSISAALLQSSLSFLLQLWRSTTVDPMFACVVKIVRGWPGLWESIFALASYTLPLEVPALPSVEMKGGSIALDVASMMNEGQLSIFAHTELRRFVALLSQARSTAFYIISSEFMSNRSLLLSDTCPPSLEAFRSQLARLLTVHAAEAEEAIQDMRGGGKDTPPIISALLDCTTLDTGDQSLTWSAAQQSLVIRHLKPFALLPDSGFVAHFPSPADQLDTRRAAFAYGRNLIFNTDDFVRSNGVSLPFAMYTTNNIEDLVKVGGDAIQSSVEAASIGALLNCTSSLLHAQLHSLRAFVTFLALCPVSSEDDVSGPMISSVLMLRCCNVFLAKLRLILSDGLHNAATEECATALADACLVLLARAVGVSPKFVQRGLTPQDMRNLLIRSLLSEPLQTASAKLAQCVAHSEVIVNVLTSLVELLPFITGATNSTTVETIANAAIATGTMCMQALDLNGVRSALNDGIPKHTIVDKILSLLAGKENSADRVQTLFDALPPFIGHVAQLLARNARRCFDLGVFSERAASMPADGVIDAGQTFVLTSGLLTRMLLFHDACLGTQYIQAKGLRLLPIPSEVVLELLQISASLFEAATRIGATLLRNHHQAWVEHLTEFARQAKKDAITSTGNSDLLIRLQGGQQLQKSAIDILRGKLPSDAALPSHTADFLNAMDGIASSALSIAVQVGALARGLNGSALLLRSDMPRKLLHCQSFLWMNKVMCARVLAGLEKYDYFPSSRSYAGKREMQDNPVSAIIAADRALVDPQGELLRSLQREPFGEMASTVELADMLHFLRLPPALAFAAVGYGFGPADYRGYRNVYNSRINDDAGNATATSSTYERCLRHSLWCDSLHLIATLHRRVVESMRSFAASYPLIRDAVLQWFMNYRSTLHTSMSFRHGVHVHYVQTAKCLMQENNSMTFGSLRETEATALFLRQLHDCASEPESGADGSTFENLLVRVGFDSSSFGSEAGPNFGTMILLSIAKLSEYLIRDLSCLLGDGSRGAGILVPSIAPPTAPTLKKGPQYLSKIGGDSDEEDAASRTGRLAVLATPNPVAVEDDGKEMRDMAANGPHRMSVVEVTREERRLSVLKRGAQNILAFSRKMKYLHPMLATRKSNMEDADASAQQDGKRRVRFEDDGKENVGSSGTLTVPSLKSDLPQVPAPKLRARGGRILVPGMLAIVSTDHLLDARLFHTLAAGMALCDAVGAAFGLASAPAALMPEEPSAPLISTASSTALVGRDAALTSRTGSDIVPHGQATPAVEAPSVLDALHDDVWLRKPEVTAVILPAVRSAASSSNAYKGVVEAAKADARKVNDRRRVEAYDRSLLSRCETAEQSLGLRAWIPFGSASAIKHRVNLLSDVKRFLFDAIPSLPHLLLSLSFTINRLYEIVGPLQMLDESDEVWDSKSADAIKALLTPAIGDLAKSLYGNPVVMPICARSVVRLARHAFASLLRAATCDAQSLRLQSTHAARRYKEITDVVGDGGLMLRLFAFRQELKTAEEERSPPIGSPDDLDRAVGSKFPRRRSFSGSTANLRLRGQRVDAFDTRSIVSAGTSVTNKVAIRASHKSMALVRVLGGSREEDFVFAALGSTVLTLAARSDHDVYASVILDIARIAGQRESKLRRRADDELSSGRPTPAGSRSASRSRSRN